VIHNDKNLKEEMAQAPFFSVVIPAFNAAHHIVDALTSVFAQTISGYEIIVVNDGSADTEHLERELEPYLNQVIYVAQKNGGPAAARNTGIRRATGEYIAFLDSDDQWLPQHLSRMKKVLLENPTLDLVYGDAVNFGDGVVEGTTTMESNPSEGLATFESLVLGRCTVIGSTVVARRQSLVDAGLFDESLVQGEDFDLWARLAYRGGRIDYQRSVQTRRRIHQGNLTADIIGSFEGQARVLRKLMTELDVSDRLKAQMEEEVHKCNAAIALERSKQLIVDRRYKEAITELKRANTTYRSPKLQLVLCVLHIVPQLVRHAHLRQRLNGTKTSTSSIAVLLTF
jgi:glycosyltransferase involved in cell wall biosynthesis